MCLSASCACCCFLLASARRGHERCSGSKNNVLKHLCICTDYVATCAFWFGSAFSNFRELLLTWPTTADDDVRQALWVLYHSQWQFTMHSLTDVLVFCGVMYNYEGYNCSGSSTLFCIGAMGFLLCVLMLNSVIPMIARINLLKTGNGFRETSLRTVQHSFSLSGLPGWIHA